MTSALVTLFIVGLTLVAADPECKGDNEEYNECGTACPTTCENYRNPVACTLQCSPGCFCTGDLVRDSDNKCVRREDCKDPECKGENEEYNGCGTACPLTCANYKNPKACTKQCSPGCFCTGDLVRDSNGKCVKRQDCPLVKKDPKCKGENEEYRSCGTACPPTCENYQNPRGCTKQCSPGCFCTGELVRNSDGKCVKREDCKDPKCKGKNEEYRSCGTACPPTCENYQNPVACILQCSPGCFCTGDLVRNSNGECVQREDCKVPQCDSDDEEFKSCGTACPKTCGKREGRVCAAVCVPGCFCKNNWYRNSVGKCVPADKC